MKIIEKPNVNEYIRSKNTNLKRICYTLTPKYEKELKLYYDRLTYLFDTCQTIKAKAIHGLSNNYKKLIADFDYIYDACVFVKNKKKPHYTETKIVRKCGEILYVNLHKKSILFYHYNYYSVFIIENYFDVNFS